MTVEVSVSTPEILQWLPPVLLEPGWIPLWIPTLEKVETSVNFLGISLQPLLISHALKSRKQQVQ